MGCTVLAASHPASNAGVFAGTNPADVGPRLPGAFENDNSSQEDIMPTHAPISRRQWLALGAIGSAAMALTHWPGRSAADPISSGGWNPRPEHFGMTREYKVLELYLYGGMSPWETFYVRDVPNWANANDCAPQFSSLVWECSDTVDPALVSPSRLLAHNELGQPIYLGPPTTPLFRARSNLADRMRVLVMRHDLLPHEAAIPYAMTGLKLGNPRFAGMGAALSRRARSLSNPTTPLSFAVIPDPFFAVDNLVATTSVGTHPAENRPLQLKVGAASQALADRLRRTGMSAQHDALVNAYLDAYRAQMTWPSVGRLRSKHFDSYEASLRQVLNAPALQALLTQDLFEVENGPICVHPNDSDPALNNPAKTGLRLAAHLLSAGSARYVAVVDNGRYQDAGSGYDGHSELGRVTYANLYSTLHELETLCHEGHIDLDDTLIVINTEFGRTPWANSWAGRDHYPLGYAVAMLGGPIHARGVAGHMGGSNQQPFAAEPSLIPTDLVGAALLAGGVNPTNHDIFAVGDFGPRITGVSEAEVRQHLAQNVLGLSV
jgi:hypothetical protein